MVVYRLSIWADGLPSRQDCFAVVTKLHADQPPEMLGQTETVRSKSPDFCSCIPFQYEFGGPDVLVVSLIAWNVEEEQYETLGSLSTPASDLLAAKGSLAQQLPNHGNGSLAIQMVPKRHTGQLQFDVRGFYFKNTDAGGLLSSMSSNKADPYFELQLARDDGTWDAVFRSAVIKNSLNPIFPPAIVDLDLLSDNKFKLVVLDFDKHDESDDVIGESSTLSIEKMQQSVSELPRDALEITHQGEVTGKILFTSVNVVGSKQIDEEPEIAVSPNGIPPTFFNYVNGGCDLKLLVGIDATASNGDPRNSTSLHYFQGTNCYESAIYSVCEALSQFDSDHKFPVHGFGAKIQGALSHCFEIAESADGVQGILQAYDSFFKSGVVMSAPRDFGEIIRRAGTEAETEMKSKQSYSVLVLFTNGDPTDAQKTLEALKAIDDSPLSVIFVGVGDGGSFQQLESLTESTGRDKVQFVHYQAEAHGKFTEQALQCIPKQLETYFTEKNIYPLDPPNEISVMPFDTSNDIEVPMQISNSGQVTISSDVRPPSKESKLNELQKFGKDLHKKLKQNKHATKILKRVNRRTMRQAKQKVNRFLGTKIL